MNDAILFGIWFVLVGVCCVLNGLAPEAFGVIFSRRWKPRDSKELRIYKLVGVAFGALSMLFGLGMVSLGLYFRLR